MALGVRVVVVCDGVAVVLVVVAVEVNGEEVGAGI